MSKILKTSIDSVLDVINVLEMADVKTNTSLTGDIRLVNRKLDSTLEDIILFCNASGASQITENIIHINIHVPNKKNQPSGNPTAKDNTQPNIERMQDIGRVVMEVLDEYRGFDFSIHLETTGEVIPDKDKWYYNIVLRYFYLRKDKK